MSRYLLIGEETFNGMSWDEKCAQFSGLAAGEGCFRACWENKRSPMLRFTLKLRDDDSECLIEAPWILGCGYVTPIKEFKTSKPCLDFHVTNWYDAIDHVVPFFRRYPLFPSKKQVCFDIYARGAEFLANLHEMHGYRIQWDSDLKKIWGGIVKESEEAKKYSPPPPKKAKTEVA